MKRNLIGIRDGWELIRVCTDGHIPVCFFKRNNYKTWTREIEVRDSGGKIIARTEFKIKNNKDRLRAIAELKQKTKLLAINFPYCF